MSNTWLVVKVGGSLFDWPDLGERLRSWLARRTSSAILLVPGGGAFADAVRALDRTHRLGEESSHWLALRAMSLNAVFLHKLLPAARIVPELPTLTLALDGPYILDPYPFFRADEARRGHLPHDWAVTSDSLSVRAAVLAGAPELVLLKSVDRSQNQWSEATPLPFVDGYFPEALRQSGSSLRVHIVNLRQWSAEPATLK